MDDFVKMLLGVLIGVSVLCFVGSFIHLGYTVKSKEDPNLETVSQGKMSTVFYHGHSYVVWGINSGGGVVHDPDCKCFQK